MEPGKDGENLHPPVSVPALSGSNESGVAQIVDEDLVDEAVLSEGLDHHHPLSAELQQDVGDVQRLQQGIASESTPSGWGGHLFIQRATHLIVLQAGDEDFGQDDHAGAAHSCAAVDQHRQVGVLWVTDAVCVSPHRLDLLQIG